MNGSQTSFSGFKFRSLFIRQYILKPYLPQILKTRRLNEMTSKILFNLGRLGFHVSALNTNLIGKEPVFFSDDTLKLSKREREMSP